MGLFDVNNKNAFGHGLFDFNHDGKTSWDEQYIAYKIYQSTINEDEDNSDQDSDDD